MKLIDKKDEIAELLKTNTASSIAKMLGVRYRVLLHMLDKNDMDAIRIRRNHAKALLMPLHKTHTINKMVALTGISRSRVIRAIEQFNIKSKFSGKKPRVTVSVEQLTRRKQLIKRLDEIAESLKTKSVKSVAELFCVSYDSMRWLIESQGLSVVKIKHDYLISRLLPLYRTHTTKQMAEATGVSYCTVYRLIDELSLLSRSK